MLDGGVIKLTIVMISQLVVTGLTCFSSGLVNVEMLRVEPVQFTLTI